MHYKHNYAHFYLQNREVTKVMLESISIFYVYLILIFVVQCVFY